MAEAMDAESNEQGRRVLPPVYFLLAIAIMVALHYVIPIARWLEAPWKWLGLVPILVGVAFAGTASAQFRRHGTPIKPFQLSSALVIGGAFRVSRNPMYLGMVSVLAGIGICLGTGSPFVVIPFFVWLISVRFIRVEEASLKEQFGEEFVSYMRRVRRWI